MIYGEKAMSNTDTNKLQPNMNNTTNNYNNSSGQIKSDIVENTNLSGSSNIAASKNNGSDFSQHNKNFKTYNNKNYRFIKSDFINNHFNLNRMPNLPPYNTITQQAFNFVPTNPAQFYLPLDFQQHSHNIHVPHFNNFYNTNDINTKQSYINHKSYVKAKKAENLHKLWPHSAKTTKTKTNKKDKKMDHNNEELKKEETPSNQLQSTKEENVDTNNNTNNETDTKNKNKTSMCMINELVKCNKIKHEYVLLDEIGPAHKKMFFVSLKLGIGTETEETYTGNGTSIKKAQHAAAELALKETKFKHPVKRNKNTMPIQLLTTSKDDTNDLETDQSDIKNDENNKKIRSALPPTVLLNSLAMKLGLVANYKQTLTSIANNIDYTNIDPTTVNNFNNFTTQKYEPFKYNRSNKIIKQNQFDNNNQKQLYKVQLNFAEKDFNGEGSTLQIAKHDAASKALEYFSNPENFLKAKQLVAATTNKSLKAYRPPQFYKNDNNGNENDTKENSTVPQNSKSEIMLVYDYAFRLKKQVEFELIQESGPSHDKKYITRCSIGTKKENSDITTSNNNESSNSENDQIYIEATGEGNSKKNSKKNAAIQMVKILKEKFEPILALSSPKKVKPKDPSNEIVNKSRKNKAKNIIVAKKTSPDYGKGSINPISRLIQIQQASKQPEPLFELITKENDKKIDTKSKKAEFIMQVKVKNGDKESDYIICEGRGLNKKQAKQNAAEAMLVKLGYQAKVPLKPSLKSTNSDETNSSNEKLNSGDEKSEKKVKFLENVITFEPPSTNINTFSNDNPKSIKSNQNQDNKNQFYRNKLKLAKEKLESNNSKHDLITSLDKENMGKVYKIAYELLESVKNNPDSNEFKSPTAELLDELTKEQKPEESVNVNDIDKMIEDKAFKILNGSGNTIINYKKILEYLSDKMKFKVNYQSLMARDGLVNSYVSLSILPETDKPLNGQGATHIESSNLAALCALEYLSSKFQASK